MDDAGPAIAVVLVFCLSVIGLVKIGQTTTDARWEAMLVDQPAQVEAIKKRVLAERAVDKLKRGE